MLQHSLLHSERVFSPYLFSMGVSRDGAEVGVLLPALAVLMALGFAGCRLERNVSTFYQDTTNQYYKFQNEVWQFLHCFWFMSAAKHLPYRHRTGKSCSSTEFNLGKVNEKTLKKTDVKMKCSEVLLDSIKKRLTFFWNSLIFFICLLLAAEPPPASVKPQTGFLIIITVLSTTGKGHPWPCFLPHSPDSLQGIRGSLGMN